MKCYIFSKQIDAYSLCRKLFHDDSKTSRDGISFQKTIFSQKFSKICFVISHGHSVVLDPAPWAGAWAPGSPDFEKYSFQKKKS